MALTRKFLAALGIEDAKVDEIIDAHTEVTSSLKRERDEYREKAERYDAVQKDLTAAQAKVKEYEEKSGTDEWEVKYNEMVKDRDRVQKEFDDYKADIDAKAVLAKKQDAYKKLLKDTGVSERRLDAVLKVTDMSKIALDKDGNIKDADKLVEGIKTEWSDFIATEGAQGAKTPNPPANNGGTGGKLPVSRAAQLAAQYNAERYGSAGKKGE